MNFYDEKILPHVIHIACGSPAIEQLRAGLVSRARGNVLEVGIGSGLNLKHYRPAQITKLWGLEPSHGMRAKAAERVAEAPFNVVWLDLPGEAIPLPDASVDTIVLTFTLCTIPDFRTALAQMHRVLKPDGTLLFCEHGAAPDAGVRRWQDRINPIWSRLAGGCQLNRNTPQLLTDAGFDVRTVETQYVSATPKFAGFTYVGHATK